MDQGPRIQNSGLWPAELVSFNIFENSIFGPLLVDILYNVFREILGVTGSSISKSSSGDFPLGTQATVQMDFDFNDRFPDAVPATAVASMTTRLTRLQLDHNGTNTWSTFGSTMVWQEMFPEVLSCRTRGNDFQRNLLCGRSSFDILFSRTKTCSRRFA